MDKCIWELIAVLHQVGLQLEKPLIAHAATSTTHPRACFEIFDQYVRPFWQEHPPRYRLSAKPYKSVWDKNAVLPEDSLTFKVASLSRCSSMVSAGSCRLWQADALAGCAAQIARWCLCLGLLSGVRSWFPAVAALEAGCALAWRGAGTDHCRPGQARQAGALRLEGGYCLPAQRPMPYALCLLLHLLIKIAHFLLRHRRLGAATKGDTHISDIVYLSWDCLLGNSTVALTVSLAVRQS